MGSFIWGLWVGIMGAGFSSSASESGKSTGLADLPENCIALVLSRVEQAGQICRLARVNATFRRAAESDTVWELRLPENHRALLRNLLMFDDTHPNLKLIYSKLCHPTRFQGDTMEAWLDRRGGGICVAISWKAMKITGINDRRYWTHIPTPNSRFHTIAYLQQTWWLEVEGQLEFEFPKGAYSLFFRLRLGWPFSDKAVTSRRQRVMCNHAADVHKVYGWDVKPVQFQLWSSNGQHAMSKCFLQEHGIWVHQHVGDFIVEDSGTPTVLKFSMAQIDCTHTKGGLCLDSVLILPRNHCTFN